MLKFKADTPEQMKLEIVRWLAFQATAAGSSARLAVRVKVKQDFEAKAKAYMGAADLIEKAIVEPRSS